MPTLTQGAGDRTQQGDRREAYNAYVLSAGSGCDGVIDQAAATSNPSDPTMYPPAYDSGDHLHPNDAGYQAIANAVNLNLFGGGAEGPTADPAAAVPGTVQAGNYATPGRGLQRHLGQRERRHLQVRRGLQTTADTQETACPGPYDLGWTATGQWFKYTVNVPTAGPTRVSLRLASQRRHRRAAHRQLRRDQPVRRGRRARHRRMAELDHGDNQRDAPGRPVQTLTIDQDNGGWKHPLPDAHRVRERGLRRDADSRAGELVQAGNYDTGGQGVQRHLGQRQRCHLQGPDGSTSRPPPTRRTPPGW